jgi:CheY-like chemotaxis protein
MRALSARKIAVVGLPAHEAERLCVALESAGAKPVFFELSSTPDPDKLADFSLVVTFVHPESFDSRWLDPTSGASGRPTVFVGHRDHLLSLEPAVQSMAREFLMDSWQPDEALVRLALALSQYHAAAYRQLPALPSAGRVRAVIADDDGTLLSLVRTVLENFGMECIPAVDGRQALELVRQRRPEIAVLDVNMPHLDGYEVLASIRREEIPSRVLLLTARQQEADIIRAFALGADDYVVKPFNPMELVARVKRLLVK